MRRADPQSAAVQKVSTEPMSTAAGALSILAALVVVIATYWQWVNVDYDTNFHLRPWAKYGLLPGVGLLLVASLALLLIDAAR
jgi:uncharacterized membrane protein YidH (DUF202 family)